jgi:hypothetical protein
MRADAYGTSHYSFTTMRPEGESLALSGNQIRRL